MKGDVLKSMQESTASVFKIPYRHFRAVYFSKRDNQDFDWTHIIYLQRHYNIMLLNVKGFVRRSIERGHATIDGSHSCARGAISTEHLFVLKLFELKLFEVSEKLYYNVSPGQNPRN